MPMGNSATQARHILLIDKSFYLKHVLADIVPEEYTLFAVADITAAFALAEHQPFDLIVCDIEQGGEHQPDICDQLKSDHRTKYIPLILASSYEHMEGIISGLHSGAEDYVTKPIIANELLARIDAHLRTKGYYQDLQKDDLLMLLQLTEMVSVTRNPRKILYIIVERIFEVIEVSRCSIMSIDDDGALTVKASSDLPPGEEIKIDIHKYPEIATALKTQRPVVIRDAPNDPLMAPVKENIRNLKDNSIFVVPIVKKQNVIGTFFLRTMATGVDAISDRVYKLCQIVSNIVGNALENAILFEAMSNTKKLLEDMSVRDSLTRLYNHQYLHARLEEEFFRAERYAQPLACLFIDMDDFKLINDRYGHLVGDVVLKQVALLLKHAVRKSDIAARYGGEEFGVVLPNTDREGANEFSQRLLAQIQQLPIPQLNGARLSASIGVATFPENASTSYQALLQCADKAMYEAKQAGKNRVCLASACEG